LTSQVMALLDNAMSLCVYRQQRPLAKDVVAACKLLVSGTPLDKITPLLDSLEMAIPGKMSAELTEMFVKTGKAALELSPR